MSKNRSSSIAEGIRTAASSLNEFITGVQSIGVHPAERILSSLDPDYWKKIKPPSIDENRNNLNSIILRKTEASKLVSGIIRKYRRAKKMIQLLNYLKDTKPHLKNKIAVSIDSTDIKDLKIQTNKRIQSFGLFIETIGGSGFTPAEYQLRKLTP